MNRSIETLHVGTGSGNLHRGRPAWPVALLLAIGLPGCVDAPDSLAASEQDSLASNVATVSMAFPDDAGVLHNGVVVVSSDLALRAADFVSGARAIVKPGKKSGKIESAADGKLAFQQRTASATAAIAAAVSSGGTALVGIVFEDSSVIGWSGPMRAAADPDGSAQTNGGGTFWDSIQTVNPAIAASSGHYLCPAGAGAHGTLVFGTTSTNITWFLQGLPIMPPAFLNSPGWTYSWPANFFQNNNAVYHVTSQQTGAPPATTGVNSGIDCYWFGF
jgi:hypothetical protein